MDKKMDTEYIIFLMGMFIKVNLKKVEDREEAHTDGLMELYTLDNGLMTICVEVNSIV